MKKVLLSFAVFCATLPILGQQEISQEQQNYRRSSLCLILLTHSDKKYAEAMERVFRSFPLPLRYNEHNIPTLRVVKVTGKQSRKDIEKMLMTNAVGQGVVSRWFNRNPVTGDMDMNLIHSRGGYSATFEDMQNAQYQEGGMALLQDNGIELLQSTFVLVCDLDYIDKAKGAKWAAFGAGLLSLGMAGMSAYSNAQANNAANRGDYDEARRKRNQAAGWGAGAVAGAAATAIVADIGGFRVKLNAYLYKLNWNDSYTQDMYSKYWCSSDMDAETKKRNSEQYDNDKHKFSLEFIGNYKTTSSKTILRSWKNEDEVILDVCDRCVNKGIVELAKKFPIFRPRAPFYFEDSKMFSHIGRKEDVTYGKAYEILQPYKDKKGIIQYNKVGEATAGKPWSNQEISFDNYFDCGDAGTQFYLSKCSVDANIPGLQLREK